MNAATETMLKIATMRRIAVAVDDVPEVEGYI